MRHRTYVINLDGSDARMQATRVQLESAGISFERVSAFDGRHVNPDEFPECDPEAAKSYMGRPLRGGEVGCYLSHLDCVRRFLQSDAQTAMVLEDDITIVPGAKVVLDQALAWLETSGEPWWLINVGAAKRKIYTPLAQFAAGGRSHELAKAHYFPMTTNGLVWSRAGAEAFLRAHSRIFAPIDNYFRHWLTRKGHGLSLYPPIVPPSGTQSEIDEGGRARKLDDRVPFYGLRKQRRLWQDKMIAIADKFGLIGEKGVK
ncbi:glycosyltransferase family 25 protein [Defluviimonas sp. WL0002]|uniref:Glycosyltransferase family 25 protein n=1 Tax=Albidovulum marisflavi TaxID=2984159 RepID=A0ABT2Z7Z6_9RHOB|nr:glycosyltransferase family 25 protein [Defluviimonas sp. WL0002]MCV2867221.1 glycosyltransferase family 25 protein [Defluviimonas sp. WL0002]